MHPMPDQPLKVSVESQIRTQIPAFMILGLASQVIQESKERVISSFEASGFEFPRRKVITYLGPPEIPKTGSCNDLAIAASILFQEQKSLPAPLYAWGELSPGGEVKAKGYMAQWCELLIHEPGTLLAHPDDISELIRVITWRKRNGLSIPNHCFTASCQHFRSAFDAIKNVTPLKACPEEAGNEVERLIGRELPPLSPSLARWLVTALSGEHHWLMLGAKGVGKSTALRWAENFSGQAKAQDTWLRQRHLEQWQSLETRPVRRVHSSAKPTHLLGGFSRGCYAPGDLIRAHGGILFADEFPEWARDTKETLREPLEEKRVRLTRRDGTIDLECHFQWMGTGNLCPCGGTPARLPPDPKGGRCRCSDTAAQRYLERLSGPVLDRLDLVTWVSAGHHGTQDPDLFLRTLTTARNRITTHYKKPPGLWTAQECEATISENQNLQKTLAQIPKLSLRSRHKVLRVAATLAAVEDQKEIMGSHVLEALQARPETWLY